METVIAGWAAGYLMGIFSTAAITYLVVATPEPGRLRRWIGEETPAVLVFVPLFLGATLLWTMIGLLLASTYEVGDLGDRQDALGSPSGPFLLIVGALAWLPLPPLVLVARRRWWLWFGLSLVFFGLFGWAVPLMAEG